MIRARAGGQNDAARNTRCGRRQRGDQDFLRVRVCGFLLCAQLRSWEKRPHRLLAAKHQSLLHLAGQAPCRTRPSCKRSAGWLCLAHGAENLPGLFRWRRARPRFEDLERRALDRVGKSALMPNGPAATPKAEACLKPERIPRAEANRANVRLVEQFLCEARRRRGRNRNLETVVASENSVPLTRGQQQIRA
jgi:hypothetical protein